jgi:class 3 adenylate cyclase
VGALGFSPCIARPWEEILSGDRVERRLAAILAADVAGYSRPMGRDKAGTSRASSSIGAN